MKISLSYQKAIFVFKFLEQRAVFPLDSLPLEAAGYHCDKAVTWWNCCVGLQSIPYPNLQIEQKHNVRMRIIAKATHYLTEPSPYARNCQRLPH